VKWSGHTVMGHKSPVGSDFPSKLNFFAAHLYKKNHQRFKLQNLIIIKIYFINKILSLVRYYYKIPIIESFNQSKNLLIALILT
jgi:hypothetical protein